jgi:carbonic anhydrase
MAAMVGIASLSVFAVAACGNSGSDDKVPPAANARSSSGAQSDGEGKTKTPPWGYEGADGPANWAALSEDFAACEKGHEQSPIDLTEKAAVESHKATTIDYKPVTAELVNNGHTVQADVSPGSKIVLDGTSYNLKQFHFHLPSEHTENGEHAAMELHFVHMDKKGKIAVVGVLMEKGSDGKSPFGPLWKKLPAKEGDEAKITEPIDLTAFLPKEHDQYRYEGSLTTPPCTEGVKWTVLEDSVEVSPAEVAAYKKLFPKDSRPVQARNGRDLSHVGK